MLCERLQRSLGLPPNEAPRKTDATINPGGFMGLGDQKTNADINRIDGSIRGRAGRSNGILLAAIPAAGKRTAA
jgi:hypothetical protein